MGYIYKITNTVSGKMYVGETKEEDVERRWKQHKNTIKHGRGCPALQDAVRKYGWNVFKFEIVVIRGLEFQGLNPDFTGVLLLYFFILASMKGSLQGHVS